VWRHYQILLHRYVEQFMQREVANTLGLGIRQLRRQEWLALCELAGRLWMDYHLAESAYARHHPPSRPNGEVLAMNTVSREQELAWSQKSFPSESATVDEIFQTVIQTVEPLTKLLHVRTVYAIPENLPYLAIQVVTVRQALLSALTTAIRAVPGGQIRIVAEAVRHAVRIQIAGENHNAQAVRLTEENSVEGLEMARQLVGFSGGQLEFTFCAAETQAFAVCITLPTEEQLTVLAIDDNPDTLALLQRYASGTRYQLVGARELTEALTLAAELRPQAIVLDVMLPGIDGWELLGRLREHPMLRGVPIIVSTVLPEEQLALALGAAAFLRKPLSRDVFLTTLDAQIERIR
jgi:CheY-like chemotaxis protein